MHYSTFNLSVKIGFWLLILMGFPLGGVERTVNAAQKKDRIEVVILQTSDIHGHVLPWDYFRGVEADRGLARISTYVKQVRCEEKNVILLDNGDTIQGTPLTYYFENRDLSKTNPMMLVMNQMKYDAMTVGNHEYNYGLDILLKCRQDARFPFLSANTYSADRDRPFFTPYIIREFGGVRIGIIGLTTSNVPNWETPENYNGLIFRPTIDEARKWIRVLREKEKCAAVVINTHEGFEKDLDSGQSNGTEYENSAWAMVHGVPGMDVLLTGHSHENISPRILNGVLISEPGKWGSHVTHITLLFQKDAGRWRLVEKSGVNVPMNAVYPPDPKVTELIRPYHDRVSAWINSEIGTALADFSTANVFTGDNPLMDLLQEVMLEHTGAEMSMAAYLPEDFFTIKKGPVTVRDIYRFYIYENTTVTLAIKGRDIRDALEHSARFYDYCKWDPADGRVKIFQKANYRKYNFDALSGADYAIDPSRPVGHRVVYLERNGRPLEMDREYLVAVSNYQAAGGGHYQAFHRARVVKTDSADIRNLLIEYISKRNSIYPECDHNWHLVFPSEIVFTQKAH